MNDELQPAIVAEQPTTSTTQRRSQLSLRALFLSVTYFAVASSLAVLWSPGVYVIAAGFFLAWLSYRGYLWWLQVRQARTKLFGFAWLLFAISFALPAMTVPGCGNSPPTAHYGWQVAWNGVSMFLMAFETALDPQIVKASVFALKSIIVNLPNAMMLLSPWLLYRQQRHKGGDLPEAWGCAAVSTWCWSSLAFNDLKVGYYVWSAAITIEFLRRKPGFRALIAMAIFAIAFLLLNWLA